MESKKDPEIAVIRNIPDDRIFTEHQIGSIVGTPYIVNMFWRDQDPNPYYLIITKQEAEELIARIRVGIEKHAETEGLPEGECPPGHLLIDERKKADN